MSKSEVDTVRGKEAVSEVDSASESGGALRDAKKREILKKAGIAGGVAATGAWTKPVVNSMVLPSHAATSPGAAAGGALSMAGPSGSTIVLRDLKPEEREGLLARIANSVVPEANAQGALACVTPSSSARYALNSDHQICVGLEFPEGKKVDGPVNITISAPDVSYSFYEYNSGETVQNFSHNLSGSMSTTLNGLGFTVSIGNLDICGAVTDADFSGASGFITTNTQTGESAYNFVGEESGYGASFDAVPGLPCSPGPGPDVSMYEAYTGFEDE